MAREISRWDPNRDDVFDDFRNMRRMLDRFMGGGSPARDMDYGGLEEPLPVDIYEKGNQVIVKAALPGVDPKDVDIRVADGILHIRAETKEEQEVDRESYHRREYRYGRFSRSFRLPPNLDTTQAEARYDNGMLRLCFPKTEAAREKSIQIQVNQAPGQQPTQNQPTGNQNAGGGKQISGKQDTAKQR